MGLIEQAREDADGIIQRDPAARSRLSVVFCYPGFHAIMIHRLAHFAWRHDRFFIGRLISHFGRMLTGIEIHPGARLGRRLFIDHGMGCVIGETAEIGDDVTLYQGVTLGGVSLAMKKRHPTLENGVIVGAGAKILGPFIVGAGARVAANAVVLKEVPPGVTMAGVPARQVLPRNRDADPAFQAYGTPQGDIPDPVAKALEALSGEVMTLRKRLDQLNAKDVGPDDLTAARDEPDNNRPRDDHERN